jgi:hypothetical protein
MIKSVYFGGYSRCLWVVSFCTTRKSYLKEVDPNVIDRIEQQLLQAFIKGFLLNFINVVY